MLAMPAARRTKPGAPVKVPYTLFKEQVKLRNVQAIYSRAEPHVLGPLRGGGERAVEDGAKLARRRSSMTRSARAPTARAPRRSPIMHDLQFRSFHRAARGAAPRDRSCAHSRWETGRGWRFRKGGRAGPGSGRRRRTSPAAAPARRPGPPAPSRRGSARRTPAGRAPAARRAGRRAPSSRSP